MAAAMTHGRLALVLLAAAALFVAAGAQSNCASSVKGYSSSYGKRPSKWSSIDWSSQLKNGPISKITFYSNATCVLGVRIVFGKTSMLAGTDVQLNNRTLSLGSSEFITQADVKNSSCVEYVKLWTNVQNKTVTAGNTKSKSKTLVSKPATAGNRLLALRINSTQAPSGTKPQLRQLQFAWGSRTCTAPAPVGVVCPAVNQMCEQKAGIGSMAYCPFISPWTSSRCVGGCCASTGKCASASCTISGLGKEVTNIMCYGLNTGIAISGSSSCAGLACRLSVPGCTTEAFGGNCVGTVVAINGSTSQLTVSAKSYLGLPCLDATPSSNTLTSAGKSTTTSAGIFVAKLWSICNCSSQVAANVMSVSSVGDAAPSSVGLPSLNSIISSLKPDASPVDLLSTVAALLPARNATGALPSLGSLLPASPLSLPDLPTDGIPALNLSLPGIDLAAMVQQMIGPDGSGLSDVLQALSGGDANSPLSAIATFVDSVKNGDPLSALQQLLGEIPSGIASPSDFADWMITLVPTTADGTSPLQNIADAIKGIAVPAGTGNPITDILSKLPNAAGADNPIAPLLDMLAQVGAGDSGSGTGGSPFTGLQQLLESLPTDGSFTAPDLSQLSGLLSLLPNAQDGSTGNPISGLASLLSVLPIQDANGDNPLTPLVNILNAIPTGVTDNADQTPGGALAGLLSALFGSAATDEPTTPSGLQGLLEQLGSAIVVPGATSDGTSDPSAPNLLATFFNALLKGGPAGGSDPTASDTTGDATDIPGPLAALQGILSSLGQSDPLGILGGAGGDGSTDAGTAAAGLQGLLDSLAQADPLGIVKAIGGGSTDDTDSAPASPLQGLISFLGSLAPAGDGSTDVVGSAPGPLDFLSKLIELLPQPGDAISGATSNPIADFLANVASGTGTNPVSSFLDMLANGEGSNPVADFFANLPKLGDLASDQTGGLLPSFDLSTLFAPLGGDTATATNPIKAFLDGLSSLSPDAASSQSSNPLVDLLSGMFGL